MRISKAFPSKFLKAGDLGGKKVTVKIKACVESSEDDGIDGKPVLYFHGAKKGLALNVTNATAIAESYGDDTDDWIGHPVVLYETKTNFRGKRVPCLRVEVPGIMDLKKDDEPPIGALSTDEPDFLADDEIPI